MADVNEVPAETMRIIIITAMIIIFIVIALVFLLGKLGNLGGIISTIIK